jgi:hypothetical protein
LIDGQSRNLGVAMRPERHEVLVKSILRENPFIHPAVMLRRQVLETLGGYDERLRRSQDYDLWLRSYRRFRFHNLQEPLIRYRVRRKLSWEAITCGTRAIAAAIWRDKLPITRYWFPLRFLTANSLTKMGLWASRLR